ncbi:MAG TPA: uracil-DNA glycosylase [Bdellovibrionota bacterium]|nr:uracil-DNA glycosylase [Bdellovibrionota bacterium]
MDSKRAWTGFLPRNAIVMFRRGKSVATPSAPPSISSLEAELKACSHCKLCKTRNSVVAGEGMPNARLMFIGEGPGEQEDLQGRPFLGRAGQLLERMIEAIGLKREDVFITNVVKCRPPENRTPEPDEIKACSPFLCRQLELIRPEVIVTLGKVAAQSHLQTEEGISELRGRFHAYRGAKLMPTFHPTDLLRNPALKREAWMDLQLVAKELGLKIVTQKNES